MAFPQGMEALSDDVIEEAAQLTKANSIEGNKLDDIRVVYTPWSNLKKTQGMDVGQVGFHDNKKVKRVTVAKRKNPIINKLEKTRVEKFPDLQVMWPSPGRSVRMCNVFIVYR